MLRRSPVIFLLCACFPLTVFGQSAQGQDGKYHYKHELRSRQPAPLHNAQEVIDAFQKAYSAANKPRLLFLINERLLEGIEDPLELDSKSETVTRMEGTTPTGNLRQEGNVNIHIGDTTNNGPGTVEVDAEFATTQKTYARRPDKSLGPRLDPLEKAEVETILTEPFLESGAFLVAKDLLLDTNLSHLVPRLLSHKEGEKHSAKLQAVLNKTDVIVEFLISWKSMQVMRVSGDVEVFVPRGTMRVVDLKTSQILARSMTRELCDPRNARRLMNLNMDIEAEYIHALAFDIMGKLTRRWKREMREGG